MSREKIKELINGLHEEIGKLDPSDKHSKERLDGLVADLEDQLEKTDDDFKSDDIVENLTHLIEKFEIEHPKITAILSKLSMSLSNMGI